MQKLGKNKLCIQLCLLLRFSSYIFLQNHAELLGKVHVHDLYKMITYLCFLRTFFLAFNSHWQVLWVYEQYTESSLKNCRHIVLIRGKKCLSYCIFNIPGYRFLSNLKFLLEVIIHLVFFFNIISFHDLNK